MTTTPHPADGSDRTPTTDPTATSGEVAYSDGAATPTTVTPDPVPVRADGGKIGSAWVALVIGAIITILLLVFILQNQNAVTTKFFSWDFSMPLGVLMLFAAIAGALIMALFAGVRILQLRMRQRKARKAALRG